MIPLGTGETSTGGRYHPGLIAQAWMTLERLFPRRPFLGIGSDEALNEVPVGDGAAIWRSLPAGMIAVRASAEIFDELLAEWRGTGVDVDGALAALGRLDALYGGVLRPVW